MSTLERDPGVLRSRLWPRMVGAVALAVVGACGAMLLMIPARSASLLSRSNWDLATALPSYRDFPADWNYSLQGTVRRQAPSSTTASPPRAEAPASVYAPADCGNVPKILGLYESSRFAAVVRVNPSTDEIASATALSSDEPNLNARFIIWPVNDGPALIANYLDWIGRCGSYSVSSAEPGNQIADARTVTTTVDTRSANDAVAVTRFSEETAGGQRPSSTYHVMYYAVRGILLECATNLNGSDIDLVKRLALQTLQRLRTL
ncbi:MAG TPA: hypothetical protein VIO95_07985 [Mycobacterium sp.]